MATYELARAVNELAESERCLRECENRRARARVDRDAAVARQKLLQQELARITNVLRVPNRHLARPLGSYESYRQTPIVPFDRSRLEQRRRDLEAKLTEAVLPGELAPR